MFLYNKNTITKSIFLMFTAWFISGCNTLDYDKMSEQQLYQGGIDSIESSYYTNAIDYFDALENRFPFGDYAMQGQLEVLYAYYQNGDYEELISKASSFINLNPNNPQLDYALYMQGLAAWELGRYSLEGMRLVDIEKRDLGATKDSFNSFYRLITDFPDSKYAPDARQRILYLKNILAAQEVYIARFYLRRGAPEAAITRANFVIQHFHNVEAIPDAVAVLTEGYMHLELQDKAKFWLTKLKKIAPKHPQLANNKFTMLYPPDKLDKNFWQFITFDLF